MTAPLDEKGLLLSMSEFVTHRGNGSYSVMGEHMAKCALDAIKEAGFAVVSAVALPDELPVWGYHVRRLTDEGVKFSQSLRFDQEQASPTNVVTPLVSGPEAHSTIAALREKLCEVVEEREAWLGASIRQQKRARTAEAEKEALRKALEPFADIDQPEHEHLPDETPVAVQHEALLDLTLILGHFRRARAALNSREKAE
jgi:hypothetical protein